MSYLDPRTSEEHELEYIRNAVIATIATTWVSNDQNSALAQYELKEQIAKNMHALFDQLVQAQNERRARLMAQHQFNQLLFKERQE